MARLRAGLGAAAFFVAAAIALPGCGGKDERTTGTATSTTAAAATTTVEPATTTTAAPATTSTRRPAVATTEPAPSPTSPGPVGPTVMKPPAAGTYRYATRGSTTFGLTAVPFPAVTTLVVDPAAGTRQRSSRDLRDAAGNGPVTELTLDYRPDGVYLELLRLSITVGGVTDSRELRPPSPALFLPTGAGPGTSSSVDLPTATGVARVTVDVVGTGQVVVAGQAVGTRDVRIVAALAPGDVTGRQELTVGIDSASGLWLSERSVTDASANNGLVRLHSEYEATLLRLTPG